MSANNEKHRLAFEWIDPRSHIEKALSWQGIDYLRGYTTGEVPKPPIAHLMPMELTEVEAGRVVFIAHPGPQHINTIGMVHGGFTATVLDSALGCAIHSMLELGMIYSTAQLNIHYTRPIMPDVGELICEGAVVHHGRKMMTAEAYLKDGADRLYAHGTTTCLIMPLSSAKP